MMLWPLPMLQTAEHVTSEEGWCWCQPKVEDVLPFGELTIHRHFMDRPEYTEDEVAT